MVDSRIRDQGLVGGQPIGTLASLREESGFAYSTVSEAVRLLRDRGTLEIRPGRGGGLFVASRQPVVRLRHTILSSMDPAMVDDAIELRDHLETFIDVAAARFRTDADIADLRSQLAAMADASDWASFMAANWALHHRIASIGRNAVARDVYLSTLGPLRASTAQIDDDAGSDYRAARLRVHADLVAAIKPAMSAGCAESSPATTPATNAGKDRHDWGFSSLLVSPRPSAAG